MSASRMPEEVQICVTRLATGQMWSIDFLENATVAEFKELVQEKTNIPPAKTASPRRSALATYSAATAAAAPAVPFSVKSASASRPLSENRKF